MSGLEKPLMILLHGIAQGRASMQPLAHLLLKRGYPVHIIEYPWRDMRFESVALNAAQQIRQTLLEVGQSLCPDAVGQASCPYVIVAHSMGGLVTRAMLAQEAIPKPESMIFCGTPNHGSESVDKLRALALFRWIYGSLGLQLGTGEQAIYRSLPQSIAEDVPLGNIAGTRSSLPFIRYLLPRPNDGKVSVASTHLSGEQDHIVLPLHHDNIHKKAIVADKIVKFVQTHQFT